MYKIYREQQLNCDIDTAWNFFSSPRNLETITPNDMDFIVLTDSNEDIYEGMIIKYKVSPLFKISLKWTTLIKEVNNKVSFTDFQLKGPYKLWNHVHEFIPNKDGVLMKDTITYKLPLGILGNIAHKLFVKSRLSQIFDYRYKILEEIFNKKG